MDNNDLDNLGAIAPLVSYISEFPVHGYRVGAHDTVLQGSPLIVLFLPHAAQNGKASVFGSDGGLILKSNRRGRIYTVEELKKEDEGEYQNEAAIPRGYSGTDGETISVEKDLNNLERREDEEQAYEDEALRREDEGQNETIIPRRSSRIAARQKEYCRSAFHRGIVEHKSHQDEMPSSYEEALNMPKAQNRLRSIECEMASLREHRVWDVDLPGGTRGRDLSDHLWFGGSALSENEVKLTAFKFGKRKSPGPEGTDNTVVKALVRMHPSLLSRLFNRYLDTGTFPEACKVLDSLLAQRLKHWLESNELLSSFQHGFREGKSTTTALNEVLEGVEMGLNKGAWVLFVALDIDGAFNSMSWNKLMRNLMDMGCPDNLCGLVRDFLRDRRISLSFGGRKLERNCARGCPQGSCCGPILWNILVNTVFQEELPEGARLVLYADDQFLIVEAASRAKAEKCVETSLQIFSIWAHDSGLKFNISKTKVLSFKPRDIRTKRKRIKWEHKPAIRMEGRRVALVNRMTILGVVIDDKMGWQYQAEEEMVARGREALCRPVLVGSQQRGGEKEGGYRTTSSEALLVLAGLIPLGLTLKNKTIRQKIWENREDALGLEAGALESKRDPRKPPQWLPKWNWSPGGSTGIGTEVFTDGSKSRTNTGAGVVIFTNGELIFQEILTLRVDELVFSAELVAIRVALRVCAEKNFSPDRLYSDCMSALVAINLEKGQLAHQIIQELEMMSRAPELPWFRRHSLIEGNEFADRIAKAGCFRGRSLRTPVTKKEVYRRIRGHVQDLWLDRWRNSVKGREVFNGVTTPKYLCKVMSHKLIRVVRDMGSSPSLHRFKIKRNPECVYGERNVNARHYVLDCPRVVGVQEERRRARGAIESKLLRNHSKLLEKAHDVAAELFLSSMAAALQKFDIDPEQQLYTPKIVDIAAAVMEMHGYI
ncbi:hypothetical protein LAZ67_18000698 [Cordylochernes scorpioides]|uniref:Reverse transcriptase n=1 Tax=Cordylochernes scorpioides TaxID=51811 RepID=A0ABY6LHW6_9ARAC|nr:hypothetical protein LAZ67_18000698 [Cordylochernes scorpioides]